MKLIVITPPHSVSDEHSSIHAMLGAGVDYVHVRKPSLSLEALREYLAKLDADVRDRLVLHVPFDSAQGTNIVEQLPSGNDEYCVSSSAPFDKLRVTQDIDEDDRDVMLSLSKHGQNLDLYNYIFLSPIFPSISKENYGEEPNIEQLKNIVEQIPTETIALGGIDPSRVAACHELGFAGIACLGHIWNAKTPTERLDRVIEMRELCMTALTC